MTKSEFCEKWKHGCSEYGWLLNRESMINDLDRVIYEAVCGWKEFVDAQVDRSINLDEWYAMEAAAIEKRQNST